MLEDPQRAIAIGRLDLRSASAGFAFSRISEGTAEF
jgi:hypothetical protein